LTEAREAIARTESDLATRSEEMKEAFEKQLREDRQSFEETQLAQKEKHRAEISQEASRTLQLQSEVEEETGKRRKAERAKKFYEAEAQRLKTQLQVFASSAGSGSAAGDPMATKDIASVIKDMKAMQQELDERSASFAREAIATLFPWRTLRRRASPLKGPLRLQTSLSITAAPRRQPRGSPALYFLWRPRELLPKIPEVHQYKISIIYINYSVN
jgi:hypothetical protein